MAPAIELGAPGFAAPASMLGLGCAAAVVGVPVLEANGEGGSSPGPTHPPRPQAPNASSCSQSLCEGRGMERLRTYHFAGCLEQSLAWRAGMIAPYERLLP
jgi:hypothetical protein